MIEKHKVEDICPNCKGDGWTAEHGDYHNPETGECENCPVQVGCEVCLGKGRILFEEVGKII